jgi:Zn-dependent protease with chaperone function
VDFFEQQRQRRGTSVKLVALFTASVVAMIVVIDAIVAAALHSQPRSTLIGWLIAATALTVVIIGGGMLTKTIALRAGGSAVAASVGAVPVDPTTTDPVLRRYVNVVAEMSIASGVPMPRLFVLEQEPGINAFAAGYTPADAAITATGGALNTLNRDELQGVIGHEFSHILNGDMRLNIRLIGLLNGILLLGLIGLRILAFGGGGRNRRDNNGNVILLVALAMMVLGFVGQFFASIIKAAVSRQREWLADASSVQFTRQTAGLEGAFKKIAGLPTGSALRNAHGASQVSHMLFGEGGSSFGQLFATHPPLFARIKALDPSFDPKQVEQLAQQWQAQPPNGLNEDAARGLVEPAAGAPVAPAPAAGGAVVPAQVAARVGTVTGEAVDRGAALSGALPDAVRRLAAQPSTAVPLVLALLLHGEPALRGRQLETITARLDAHHAQAAEQLADQVRGLPAELRLPLLDLAAPVVTARPDVALQALLATLGELALTDARLSLFEYCLTRLVAGYVRDAQDPSARSKPGRARIAGARDAALNLLAALAAVGNDDDTAAARAFSAGVSVLLPGEQVGYAPPPDEWRRLDAGWTALDALAPQDKSRLVQAMVAAVRDDGVLTLHEAELLRAACRLVHCPLPPFVA